MASSRPWRLTTPPPVKDLAVADDKATSRLDIPPVLPPEEMAGVVARRLEERGFREGPGGKMERSRDGVDVSVDPLTGEVETEAHGEAGLRPEEPDEGGGCGCRARSRAAAREAENDAVRRGLQAEVTNRLEKALADLNCELEGVVSRATSTALKRKAKRLGEIKAITEDEQTGSLTIVVEV
jgi:hypothetical protein